MIPDRTKKEFQKEYRENNKEIIAFKRKEYNEKNSLKHKEYYEKNKEQLLLKWKEKFNCDCGGKYTYTNKIQHFKTKKHQKFINI